MKTEYQINKVLQKPQGFQFCSDQTMIINNIIDYFYIAYRNNFNVVISPSLIYNTILQELIHYLRKTHIITYNQKDLKVVYQNVKNIDESEIFLTLEDRLCSNLLNFSDTDISLFFDVKFSIDIHASVINRYMLLYKSRTEDIDTQNLLDLNMIPNIKILGTSDDWNILMTLLYYMEKKFLEFGIVHYFKNLIKLVNLIMCEKIDYTYMFYTDHGNNIKGWIFDFFYQQFPTFNNFNQYSGHVKHMYLYDYSTDDKVEIYSGLLSLMYDNNTNYLIPEYSLSYNK